MVTYTLTTPAVIGLTNPITVASLVITGVNYSSTPPLAPLGAATLEITLTDPDSGMQFKISYQDDTAPAVWGDLGEQFAQQVFDKLVADSKIPPGSYASDQTATQGKTTQLQGMATQGGTSSNFKGL